MSLSQTQPVSYEQADPDVRLMLQVRAGNAAAFEELVLRYQARLLTVLEHLVNNREQAQVQRPARIPLYHTQPITSSRDHVKVVNLSKLSNTPHDQSPCSPCRPHSSR